MGARDPWEGSNWLQETLIAMEVHFCLHPFSSDLLLSLMCCCLGTEISVAYIVPEKSRILWHIIEVGKLFHFYQETKKNVTVSSDFASSIQMRQIYS